jgi:hypothetical protein
MRRIKVILTVVAAVVTMMMLATPAMAQVWGGCDPTSGLCSFGNPNTGTTNDPWGNTWGTTNPWLDNSWGVNSPWGFFGDDDCDFVAGMWLC